MAQQPHYGAPMLVSPDAQLIKLGQAMKELQKWWWLGICLCFLIIPAIILFVKYIQYLMALGEVKKVVNHEEMNKTYMFALIGLILSFISGPAAYAGGAVYVSGVLAFIFDVLSVISFEKWALDYNQRKHTQYSANFLKAIQDLKMATILMIIIIGIFLYPGAIGLAGDSLLYEHGAVKPPYQVGTQGQQIGSAPQQTNVYQQLYTPKSQYPQQTPNTLHPTAYGGTPAYAPSTTTQQPAVFGGTPAYAPSTTEESPVGAKFCPHCGNQLPPDAKFCGKCGGQLG